MSLTMRQRTTERQYQGVVQFATRFGVTEDEAYEWLTSEEWNWYDACFYFKAWRSECGATQA